MSSKIYNIKCPECGKQEKIVRYGKCKNTQRYKCNNCSKVFSEKNYVIKHKKEKELAISLLNLLNFNGKISSDEYEILKLSDILPSAKINEKTFKNVSVKIKSAPSDNSMIHCSNPRIIISLVEDEIKIIRLPEYPTKAARRVNRGIRTLLNDSAHYKKHKRVSIMDTYVD